jgi:hypothetical protein
MAIVNAPLPAGSIPDDEKRRYLQGIWDFRPEFVSLMGQRTSFRPSRRV